MRMWNITQDWNAIKTLDTIIGVPWYYYPIPSVAYYI